MIHPVILCGGSGTRLWPLSRRDYPKQFAPLVGDESLYQATLRRFTAEGFAAPLVLTSEAYRFLATEQAREIGLADARVLVEPAPRDTAPAILIAALSLATEDPDALMLVAPSDHVIGDVAGLHAALSRGVDAARTGVFVTFGVVPDRPETGYGYLDVGSVPEGLAALPLKAFREKPDRATAEAMLSRGGYLWNTGLFLFRVADVLAAYQAHAPDLLAPCRAALEAGKGDLDFFRLADAPYQSARAISFDYAIMEKVTGAAVIPLPGRWSDLGAWDALWHVSDRDAAGTLTSGAVTALDCADSYLRSEDPNVHLVGLGLEGITAVAMADAVLVADSARAQEVKHIVDILRAEQVAQADEYPRFYRPWGWYETLCLGDRFQVKRIMVKPGGVLSLQSHVHRAEHWVVVEGTAEVTLGPDVQLLTENQSVYIPLGQKHRLSNPGHVPMYLIEVQTGAYLGEDDITRFEDVYNRD